MMRQSRLTTPFHACSSNARSFYPDSRDLFFCVATEGIIELTLWNSDLTLGIYSEICNLPTKSDISNDTHFSKLFTIRFAIKD